MSLCYAKDVTRLRTVIFFTELLTFFNVNSIIKIIHWPFVYFL